jgi:DNA-directed RNA polymerase subunit RPC12/RpoP
MTRITVRFTHTRERAGEQTGQVTERVYQDLAAADAMMHFCQSTGILPEQEGDKSGYLECFSGGEGTPPARHLRNWEKDPFAEVADGFWNNIAADYATAEDLLKWRPEYHAMALWRVVCPECGREMVRHESQWGRFFRCHGCGAKFGEGTRKHRANRALIGFCGEPMTVMMGRNGGSGPGCEKCHGDQDWGRVPAGRFLAGRR